MILPHRDLHILWHELKINMVCIMCHVSLCCDMLALAVDSGPLLGLPDKAAARNYANAMRQGLFGIEIY